MKEKLSTKRILQKWFYTESPYIITKPALREVLFCLLHFSCGFLLSCGSISGQPAPFALGLLSSAGGGIRGLSVLIGTALGYLTMQPFSEGLSLTSSSILIYITMYIFGTTWVAKQSYFHCLVPAVMSAAIGAIFLISKPFSLLNLTGYFQTILLSGLSPLAFDALEQGKLRSMGAGVSIGFLLIGLSTITLPFALNFAVILALALLISCTRYASTGMAAAFAAVFGLCLDASMSGTVSYTVLFTLSTMMATAIPQRYSIWRISLFSVSFLAGNLFFGAVSLPQTIMLVLSIGISFLLPKSILIRIEESAAEESASLVEERLSYGKAAFLALYQSTGLDPEAEVQAEQQHIFDKAAAKVCRQCACYHNCWEKHSDKTYKEFQSTLAPILERGQASHEDFSESFSASCKHLDGLITALNQELVQITARMQSRYKLEESRLIASRILLHVSDVFGQNSALLRKASRIPPESYYPKVGVGARGRHGIHVSGDRGMCFRTDTGKFYLLLCDGAGTGQTAAKESLLAVDTLAALIQSGMEVKYAMELINNVYILRDSGSFSTMDVLELSLITGQATLYKWGAAPSYLKSGNLVKKIGTATLPPGLDVGSTQGPEIIRLSLWGGDMLILVSDGVVQTETEDTIREYGGSNVNKLASLLVSQAASISGEDDMTAAVVRLEELHN